MLQSVPTLKQAKHMSRANAQSECANTPTRTTEPALVQEELLATSKVVLKPKAKAEPAVSYAEARKLASASAPDPKADKKKKKEAKKPAEPKKEAPKKEAPKPKKEAKKPAAAKASSSNSTFKLSGEISKGTTVGPPGGRGGLQSTRHRQAAPRLCLPRHLCTAHCMSTAMHQVRCGKAPGLKHLA